MGYSVSTLVNLSCDMRGRKTRDLPAADFKRGSAENLVGSRFRAVSNTLGHASACVLCGMSEACPRAEPAAGCRWSAPRCPCNGSSECVLTVAITSQPGHLDTFDREPLWLPPPGGAWRVVNDTRQACVHVIVKSHGTPWNQRSYQSRVGRLPISSGYPFFTARSGGGVNTVFVDFSDWRIPWNCSALSQRRRVFGCATLALTHSRTEHYVPDVDISLPAGLHLSSSAHVRGGAGISGSPTAQSLGALRACDAPWQRRYWLTFRGNIYLEPEAGHVRQRLLYPPFTSERVGGPRGNRSARWPIVVVGDCSAYSLHVQAKLNMLERCEEARARTRNVSFIDLLNSTFALVEAPQGSNLCLCATRGLRVIR